MEKVIIFETETDLSALTGLNHEQLWENGFNLDDWDFGLCSDKEITNSWLINRMSNYCVGYEITEYKNKFYYMVHHA